MRTAIMFCLLSSTSLAGTLTTAVKGSWVRDARAPLTMEVTHTYNETQTLITADFQWTAAPFERTSFQKIEIPPVFPNEPGEEIVASVKETLRLIEWNAVALQATEQVGPYWDSAFNKWLLSNDATISTGYLLVERTLEGPLTTTVELLALPAVNPIGGRVRHKYEDGWIPLTDREYIVNYFDDRGPLVPYTIHDGVTISGYHLTAIMPVVPEPTALWPILVCAALATCRRRHWQ